MLSNYISKVMALLLGVLSIILFYLSVVVIFLNKKWMIEWVFFTLNGMDMSMVFLLDWMSLSFFSVVLLISASVLYYSTYYMEGEVYMSRFIMLVLLFVFSMIMVILSPNFISILLGWDGLGLVSYCLVIYYQNYKSFSAGMLTVLSNRIGDVGLLIAIGWLMSCGNWNFFYLNSYYNEIFFWVVLCVFIAGLTKSAQMPFSAWLPAAMAAPTPVSALVHSSTLVTAGVYLLIRFSHILNVFSDLSVILFYLALMTMFLAGLGANFEYDLKKIVALSTLSQLGLMMMMVALGSEIFAFFHLITHAMFKALLFLCSGKIIHVMGNNQDIRYMGGGGKALSLSLVYLNTANMSLCGFPFLAGFYSKDLILEFVASLNINNFSLMVLYLATGLTCLYSFRLSWYLSGGLYKGAPFLNMEDNESGYTTPMLFLFLGAVFGGTFFSWVLFDVPEVLVLGFYVKQMPLFLLSGGVILGLGLISMIGEVKPHYLWAKVFISHMWFMPSLSSQFVIKSFLDEGSTVMNLNDRGWGEFLGGQGIMKYGNFISNQIQAWQYNSLKIFLLIVLSWFIVFLLV